MFFTHDTEAALGFVAALADTTPEASDSGDDELTTPAELGALLDAWKYSGRRDGDQRELDEVREARARLRHLWLLDRDEAAATVNELLAEARALPRLVRHDDIDWHIHATELDAPLARRILVEAAMAFVDVIRVRPDGAPARLRRRRLREPLRRPLEERVTAVLQHALRQSDGGPRVPRAHGLSRSHGGPGRSRFQMTGAVPDRKRPPARRLR